MNITQTPAWQALTEHHPRVAALHMRDLFREDPRRFSKFSIESERVFLDYSKNRIVDETMSQLLALTQAARLPEAIENMFGGERINSTEQRAVLHTALRNRSDQPVLVDGEDVMPKVRSVLLRMRAFVEAVHSGEWLGFSGKPITDIVNIGIGGSHLGPMMVTRALKPYRKAGLRVHFISNVDSTELVETLEEVSPETVLFIVASKTFTTLETMTNAHSARDWFLKKSQDRSAIAKHFAAISTNLEATQAFGIDERTVFEFWDWVGGRYSLWSAIGLPIALYVGMDNFQALLEGAYWMDRHFRTTPAERNIPINLALLGVWYNNFFHAQSHAVIPYEQHLEHLPAYLQQLVMESNGKGLDRDGKPLRCSTGPILWGATGTNGQHAFFQLLHQGTQMVPVDFLLPLHSSTPLGRHHNLLAVNCIAQSEAFLRGKTAEEARAELAGSNLPEPQQAALLPHKVFPGNKPSNTIVFDKLTPASLGALIAMYEHKVFVEGVLWNINSFDQWGVELGKQLAGQIAQEMEAAETTPSSHDSSTQGLIERYRRATAHAP
jgi:glucose-6-phosphate isomerase